MTVAVRGRVPRDASEKFSEATAVHIQERLQALERHAAGGGNAFASPSYPSFGSGNATIASGGGAAAPTTPTTTTVILTESASVADLFLLMGA